MSPIQKFYLYNKVAIVYGGSYGIGKGISLVLSEAGATVVIISRNAEKGEVSITDLYGKEKLYIQADVTQYNDHKKVVNEVISKYHQMDIIVCCAGTYYPDSWIISQSYTEDYISSMINVNLKGSIYAVKSSVEHVKKSTAGRIIFISSITGMCTGLEGSTVYSATKAAQVGYVRSAAVELAPYNITVNSVLPGDALTEKLIALGEESIEIMKKNIPLKKLGTPTDIGNVVLFLASTEASYITGQEITIDGGQVRMKIRNL